ncbi:hypothetical protein GCM10009812_09270 [Nocardioides marinus]|uniref:Uncharacterized protein n=1 Tax=Nocardioides marinus TaxID=374514 RepID=A0A7Z0C1T3_9ACTN|nr:hypothetical protein [Nocardioides marinus]NYI08557.1 hypothetical protein [Nocardioides marinus]
MQQSRAWGPPQLVALARRVVNDVTITAAHEADLHRYIDAYDRGGGR